MSASSPPASRALVLCLLGPVIQMFVQQISMQKHTHLYGELNQNRVARF